LVADKEIGIHKAQPECLLLVVATLTKRFLLVLQRRVLKKPLTPPCFFGDVARMNKNKLDALVADS
jgi:hypothetical protein